MVFSIKRSVFENFLRNLAFISCSCYTQSNIQNVFSLVGLLPAPVVACTGYAGTGAIMKVILDSGQIEQVLKDLTGRILSETPAEMDIAVIGIRSRGEVLAQRLSGQLSQKLGKDVPCGTLDITLYRDDLNSPQGSAQPLVRTTEIGFDIDDKIIILVDDVLYTGRSARAAMDALMDLGRPRAIRLAVLVDRLGRELPIQADYAGYKADAAPGKLVQVSLVESDGKDEVVIE
jgi:pyrimidine operon attenuation protein/uracil phosphoribosyltransferase